MTRGYQVQGESAVRGVPDGVVVAADRQGREQVVEQLVRRIAAGLGVASDTLMIERRHGAAPRVTRKDGGETGAWNVNLSDTRGFWLGAAAEFPVGVDVEAVDATFEWRTVAEEFFSPAVRASWATLSPAEERRAFFCAWVRWEACLKCRGVGFGRAMLPPETAEQGLAVHDLDLGEHFAAAIAVQRSAHERVMR